MADILYNYSFGHRCFCRFSWSGTLWASAHLKNDYKTISSIIKKCRDIEEVIQMLKTNSTISNQVISLLAHFYYEVDIDDKHFTLNPEFKVFTDVELKRERFEPYIKYDIDDIREGTIKPIECRLLMECKSPEEQIELIEHYLRRPYRRFSKWSTKPNKLFLYHTYGESPKEFRICFD